jgi:hypothetical protein
VTSREEQLINRIFHAERLTLYSQFWTSSLALFLKAALAKAMGYLMKKFKEKQSTCGLFYDVVSVLALYIVDC